MTYDATAEVLRMLSDREARKVEDAKLHTRLLQEMHDNTPSYRRARRFADEIVNLIRDFVPSDRDCMHRLHETVMKAGFSANAEIICVPPECDEMDRMALERRRLEMSMAPIILAAKE